MGIVSRIRPQAISQQVEQIYREAFGAGSPTSSGMSVNSETAMRLITVQNCVRVRAATIGQLPCHVMERSGRMRNKAEDFYLYELLHDQPNSWMTASEFWGMAEAHVSLRGNFFAYKAQLPGRPIRELIPFKAGQMHEVKQNADYSLTYKAVVEDDKIVSAAYDDGFITTTGSQIKEFPQEKIMHLRGLTLNGFTGMNPIQYARETMGLGLAGEKFLARYFGSGMHPGAVVKHKMNLNAPAHASLKATLKEKMQGLGKSWDLVLLDEDMDITFPPIKLIDAQFLELMKMDEAQICGLFRVPLMLVQSGDKTPTYASAEQFMINYAVIGVTPDVVNYAKAIRRDLLTPEERKRYYAKFETRALLQSAFKDQITSFQIGVNTEIYSPNEVREFMDMNPYEGGDEYRTRTSTVKDSKGDKGNEPKVQK